jgi:hypothetical protein
MSVKTFLYESVDVWKRVNGTTLARYRCFRLLTTGKYCIQSLDYYHAPFDSCEASQHLDKQYMELLSEEPPEKRSKTFPTLQEAIEYHDDYFENE